MPTLYIDTATTGRFLYRERNRDPRQPHMARMAMLVTEGPGRPAHRLCRLIIPEPGWTWDAQAEEGHGITRGDAEARGVPLGKAVDAFLRASQDVDEIVAFNWEFHHRVLMRSLIDMGAELELPTRAKQVCAMREATDVVRKPRIAPGGGYAWPKQVEAYAYFSGGRELPPLETDPIERGLALVQSVRVIHEGTVERRAHA